MNQPLLADDYKNPAPRLRQTRHLPGLAEIDARPARQGAADLACDPAAGLETGSTTTVRAGSRLSQLRASLVKWLRECADAYAAATAYENLSRLSDRELARRGLSRDILARDLKTW